MKQPLFTGSGVAIVTPFNRETVDLNTMGRLLDFQLANGTDAVIVCGTTGEASTMTYWERMRTIEYCVEHVAGRVPVIAGAGSNSTENTIALSRDAERAGADGLLLVTPYYNKASQAGLLRHYSVTADAVHSPIILYNVPSRTGVTIAPETYAELSKHPNINGTKEASGDFSLISRTLKLCGDDLNIWSGNDDNTLALMAMGGKGVISVFTNILPKPMSELCDLCLKGDFAAAREIHNKYSNLFHDLFIETNPIPVKTAMNLLGYDVGELRLPLCEMDPANVEKLKAELTNVGLKLIG